LEGKHLLAFLVFESAFFIVLLPVKRSKMIGDGRTLLMSVTAYHEGISNWNLIFWELQ
jgi:hypothetical protein